MDEDKRKQRKTRRYVYMIAGAYIIWQGISIGIDMKNNVAADRPEMIAISAVLLILTGLALIVWQLRKLKKERKHRRIPCPESPVPCTAWQDRPP